MDIIDFFMCNSDVALLLVILSNFIKFVLKLLNSENMDAVDCSDSAMSKARSPVSNFVCWCVAFAVSNGW